MRFNENQQNRKRVVRCLLRAETGMMLEVNKDVVINNILVRIAYQVLNENISTIFKLFLNSKITRKY